MISKTTLVLLIATVACVVPVTEAFAFDTSKRFAFHAPSNEEQLKNLESEYKTLQDRLLRELATTNVHGNAEEIVEDMLEKAADVAAVQRYRMGEIVEEADLEMRRAVTDRRRAHFIKEKAHEEAQSAAREAAMIEDFDAAYEDWERLRDLSVVHADHALEHDAEVIEEESEFLELEAGDRKKQAELLLKELKENEAKLRESLKELRQSKNEHAMEEWRESEGRDHISFLGKVRNKLKHYSMKKHSY